MVNFYKNNQLAEKNFPQLNGVKIDLYFPSPMTKAILGIKCNPGGL